MNGADVGAGVTLGSGASLGGAESSGASLASRGTSGTESTEYPSRGAVISTSDDVEIGTLELGAATEGGDGSDGVVLVSGADTASGTAVTTAN